MSGQPARLHGLRAVVTGAASGIGAAIVGRFVSEGAVVLGFDLEGRESPEATCEMVSCDVSEPDGVEQSVTAAAQRLGGIDLLVNNAGIQIPGHLATLSVADWDTIHSVILKGAWLTMRSATPYLSASPAGAVVNVASVDGLIGEGGVAAYSAAKAGLVNLTRSASMDYAPQGVRVNVVCPGITDTPMFRRFLDVSPTSAADLAGRLRRTPLGRLVEPGEVAAAVAFLASPDSSGITGASLVVDNGLSAGWDYSPPDLE